jgi:hypothetical protein
MSLFESMEDGENDLRELNVNTWRQKDNNGEEKAPAIKKTRFLASA